MKFVLALLVFCIAMENFVCLVEIQSNFEFEDALKPEQNYWVWRSEASELKTLRLEDEDEKSRVELNICIKPRNTSQNITLFVDDICYSKDGPSDLVKLSFDGNNFASFNTIEKWRSGHEWNVFRNSGNLGPALNLRHGQYTLMISVITDQWDVELDRIRVNVENQNQGQKLFCGASFYFVE